MGWSKRAAGCKIRTWRADLERLQGAQEPSKGERWGKPSNSGIAPNRLSHMASTPLIDLDSIDLETVLVGPRDLDPFLKQSGRFRMLEGVLHEDVENGLLVGYRDITADDWWAKDHIPGRPLFPGALQIETAAQLSAYDYSAHRNTTPLPEGSFVGFAGVDNARFRGSVEPTCRLHIITKLLRSSKRMFRYQAQAIANGNLVFEAEILGVVF